jgi:hypothetical protein
MNFKFQKICKIDKQDLVDERDSLNEQVSQLHKCAFQMLNNNKLFMCFTNDQIVQQDVRKGISIYLGILIKKSFLGFKH